MEETAQNGPWRDAFRKSSARRTDMPTPSDYYDRLIGKSARLDIWHTIYNHPLDGASAIVEWVKGTGLIPYLARVAPEEHEQFLNEYRVRIERAYPPLADGKVLFRFPRVFIVAVKI
jgi:trans-aconitate 2-methyltransferase